MTHFNEEHTPPDLLHVVEQLRDHRPEATGLELDRVKLRLQTRTARATPTRVKGQFMRKRLVSLTLTLGLLTGGAGALAATGTGPKVFGGSGTSPKASVNSQYCPPKSPRAGKPKKPRPSRCGYGPKGPKPHPHH
jgi:hypothetical protein